MKTVKVKGQAGWKQGREAFREMQCSREEEAARCKEIEKANRLMGHKDAMGR